mmetsp:Transcript_76414/g.168822  ORF Transcript_76414/g.168822 Transcript_76414/m.168822 type:complete len:97 (-) Transcript_76414:620-910(-)
MPRVSREVLLQKDHQLRGDRLALRQNQVLLVIMALHRLLKTLASLQVHSVQLQVQLEPWHNVHPGSFLRALELVAQPQRVQHQWLLLAGTSMETLK